MSLDALRETLPATLLLTVTAQVLALLLGIPLGVLGALREHSLLDHLLTLLSFILTAIPSFFLAIIAVFVFAPSVIAFFVPSDPGVIAERARFIRIMCLTWGGIGVQLCIVSTFRASGNMVAAMLLAVISQCVFQLPVAYALSTMTALHIDGLWWSFPITNIGTAIAAACWFAWGGWRKAAPPAGKARLAAEVAQEEVIEEGIRA